MDSMQQRAARLEPEKVAYWYFRLNGFLQIENFVVHPQRPGSQCTEADLIAVRFPHRVERLIDNPDAIMRDDVAGLLLCELIEVVIAEVKTNDPCCLNRSWTERERRNIERVLAAIGCLPAERIEKAAADLYEGGVHRSEGLRIRLVAIGRCQNDYPEIPQVEQLTWENILSFIWDRFHQFGRLKTDAQQWDDTGKKIKELALAHRRRKEDFVREALQLMRVRNDSRDEVEEIADQPVAARHMPQVPN